MPVSDVPFFRPCIEDDEVEEVEKCLRSGWLTTGPVAAQFEKDFAEALGGGVHAVAVNSATAALHLGLEALGVGPGDEVILPTLTFTATAEVVRYMGATPVFADIGRETLCLEPENVLEHLTDRTKAIMPVHFAGRSCDMTGLRRIAREHGISILDDAAHALPTRHNDVLVGAAELEADATAFSFYANKTMTTGEGGMFVTRHDGLARRACTMRLHGIDRDVYDRFTNARASWFYDVVAPGFKYNLTDIAAALGRVQLRKVERFHAERTRQAKIYDDAFKDLPLRLPPGAGEGDIHSWHLYVVQLEGHAPIGRAAFIDKLKEAGIGCSVHYRPLHQMTYWQSLGPAGAFPNADDYYSRCITLPLFVGMTDSEQDYVIERVRDVLAA